MELVGYIAAVFIGLILGLIGSGGSILTVPVMVYLMGIYPVTATTYSLFVVGITSLAGSAYYTRKKLVDCSTALFFLIPSLIMVFLTRKYLLPFIPDTIFSYEHFNLSKNTFIMLLFGILMVGMCISMIRYDRLQEKDIPVRTKLNYLIIILGALLLGLITGIVGVGGGFLIIPSLVLLIKLPIKKAVGTSLVIIACNSIFGLIGDVSARNIDWLFLLSFSTFSLAGIFAGVVVSRYVSGQMLRPAFGWFMLAAGLFVLIRELMY